MSYKDLIRQEGEFTYSANIQFDINSDTKLLRYIPNETSIELLREYFSDMARARSNNHARILYGSYGTGKSHFLTVLGQVLSKSFTDSVAFSMFIGRIEQYDAALAHDITEYISDESRKPLLIVPIVFDFEDFDRCIYFSLRKKLDALGITVKYKTFYDQALTLLNQWKSTSESAERLAQACKATSINLERLTNSLLQLNHSAEKTFKRLFEKMTYGVKFVYEASNMFDILKQSNEAISDRYDGIVFIFDEFGRYIEDNLKKIKVKSIQDLAEYCDHCKENNHILLVSHKEISQYTERYSKAVAAEWKKVEGRYKSFSINSKQDQSLDIVRSVLMKNEPAWGNFKAHFKTEFEHLYASISDFHGYNIGNDCSGSYEAAFPLHPLSLFALDRLSKKVAQNDRTFFTYLAGQEYNSLFRFLSKTSLNEFHYVGVNEIYDYFEQNIKAVQSDETYEWYKRLQGAYAKGHLDEYSDDIRVLVLKVITTIGIINDANIISSDKKTIINAIDAEQDVIIDAIENLCEQKILKFSGIYQRYEFFDASIFDVSGMIEEESSHISDEAVIKTLNDSFINFVLYPYEYNREYKISRVFIPVFSFATSLTEKTVSQKLGKNYDGALIMLLGDNDTSIDNVIEKSTENERSIIWINTESSMLIVYVKKYIAAKYLETQKQKYITKDPVFEKELQYHIDELTSLVYGQIQDWKSFSEPGVIVSKGVIYPSIKTFSGVSALASGLMYEAYPYTLIVNNELINKNNVSSNIANAKKNAIRGMLQSDDVEPYYGLQYLSPDYIAVRSVLCMNGFADFGEQLKQNKTKDGTKPQDEVNQAIDIFLRQAQTSTVSCDELYATLKASPFGLRDGYIALILANKLLFYKKSLIISSHGSEQELSAELFEEMVKRPTDFTFTVAVWNKEEQSFVDALEALFISKIDQIQIKRNRLKAIYEGMLSHYKSVSKFARTTSIFVSDSTKKYRKLMEQTHKSYAKFFFEKAKALSGDFKASEHLICDSKKELDEVLYLLTKNIKNIICTTFGLTYDKTLADSLLHRYDKEWKAKRIKSFDYYTNSFLEFVEKIDSSFEDFYIVKKLAKMLSGIEISYWNDAHISEFESRLQDVKAKLIAYNVSAELQQTETKMTLTTASGEEKVVVFDKRELTDLGITIKNKINATFGNFGLAVTYDDKVQVILSLLNDLMEGK